MAASAGAEMMSGKRQEASQDPPPPPSPQPPAYYMTPGPGSPGSGPTCFHGDRFSSQLALLPPTSTTVMVGMPPVPAVQAKAPSTTWAFVLSTLTTVFCGFWCGAAAILISWKARLLVLDQKYEHARHTLRVVWIFLSLGLLFGVLVWGLVGFYLWLISSIMH